MKYNVLILALIFLAGFLITQASNDDSNLKEQQNFTQIDSFQFGSLEGKSISTQNFANNIVIIHFWATWCPPCVEEIPKIIKFANNNPDISVLTFAVNNKPDDVQKFFKKYKISDHKNLVVGLDQDKHISQNMFNTIKLPETFVMTPSFTIYETITGVNNDWNDPQWISKIKNNIL